MDQVKNLVKGKYGQNIGVGLLKTVVDLSHIQVPPDQYEQFSAFEEVFLEYKVFPLLQITHEDEKSYIRGELLPDLAKDMMEQSVRFDKSPAGDYTFTGLNVFDLTVFSFANQ